MAVVTRGIDYTNHPKASFKYLYDKYKDSFLIADEFLTSKKIYLILYQDIIDILKYCIDNPIFRHGESAELIEKNGFYELSDPEVPKIIEKDNEDPKSVIKRSGKVFKGFRIHFKLHKGDVETYHIPVDWFLINMVLWYPYVAADTVSSLTSEHIFIPKNSKLLDEQIFDYANEKTMVDCHLLEPGVLSSHIAEYSDTIRIISKTFGTVLGSTINDYQIKEAEKKDPEITELMTKPFDATKQPSEIELEAQERTAKLIEKFKKYDTGFRPLLISGKNISPGQLKEVMVTIGFKSDLNGDTISHFIDCNIFVNGINSSSSYFLEAKSGRKALILSKMKMGEPGAFSKKLINVSAPAVLRRDKIPCNSKRPIMYHIENKKQLKLLDERYYYDEEGFLRKIKYGTPEAESLIGKVISVRSPITCASKKGICHLCYGGLFDINSQLHSAGAYAATKESEPYGQKILSSKHSQVTSSNVLKMCEEFNKVFELSSNEITLNQEFEDDVYIQFNTVEVDDQGDSETYTVTDFDIVDVKGKQLYHIMEENETKFYLSPEMVTLYKRYKEKAIPISEFEDDTVILFQMEINNLELSKPLDNIESLLNKKDHFKCTTIDEIAQKYLDLKIEAGIMYNAVHHEMILRELIRKKSNIYEKPDWGPNGDHEDYQILRMDDALMKHPSPIISLEAAPQQKRQIISADFYKKQGVSQYDVYNLDTAADIDPIEGYEDEDDEDD